MKKFSILMMLCVCVCAFALTACGKKDDDKIKTDLGNINTDTGNIDTGDTDTGDTAPTLPVAFGPMLLQDCTVDIDPEEDEALAVVVKKNETVTTNNKGYLVKFDAENKLQQVNFVYEHTKTITTIEVIEGEETTVEEVVSEEIEITQEEIQASVSNLFVTKMFTYIMFLRPGYHEYEYKYTTDAKFTASSLFGCDENHQSFIIDNETNKLYPANQIGDFTNIHENFVQVDGKYYELTIDENGGLTPRKIVPNDNIHESSVLIDKFGQAFIQNDTVNETAGKFFYYTAAADTGYYLGADGYVYSFKGEYSLTIRRYEENFAPVIVPAEITISLGRNYIIKNSTLYLLTDYARFYCIPIHGGNATYDRYDYFDNVGSIFRFIGTEIFQIRTVNGKDTLFYSRYNNGTEQEITTFTSFTVTDSTVVLTRETINGTQKDEVRVVDGVVTINQLVDITYENEVITIQPLN